MYYYIINPAAGGGKIYKIQDKLKSILSDLGIAGEFIKSTGPGDIPKLAEIGLKKGYSTIVAVGGDGTINDVLNNIPNENIAFGIIPLGKTNTLAQTLGINDWMEACQILAARKTVKTNMGEVFLEGKNRFFVSSLALGLEADLQKKHQENPKQPLEKIKKSFRILKDVNAYTTQAVKFEIDSLKGEAQTLSIKIINASLFGKSPNFRLSLTDTVSGKEKIKLMKQSAIKDITGLNENTVLYGDNIRIKTTGLPVTADDQFIGVSPIEVGVASRRVRIIVNKINV